jgi:hypothetical protein
MEEDSITKTNIVLCTFFLHLIKEFSSLHVLKAFHFDNIIADGMHTALKGDDFCSNI